MEYRLLEHSLRDVVRCSILVKKLEKVEIFPVSVTQPPVGNRLTKSACWRRSPACRPCIGRGLVELRMIPAVEIEESAST